jgi:hypothetical protein
MRLRLTFLQTGLAKGAGGFANWCVIEEKQAPLRSTEKLMKTTQIFPFTLIVIH